MLYDHQLNYYAATKCVWEFGFEIKREFLIYYKSLGHKYTAKLKRKTC